MELFSVSAGKFHKPATGPTREEAWKPRLTVCGKTLTPVNFFETADDANAYTGGRLHLYLCQHCVAAKRRPTATPADPPLNRTIP
jgi:hypothetical protein